METYFLAMDVYKRRLHMVPNRKQRSLKAIPLVWTKSQLNSPQRRSVVCNDDQLGLALTQCLQGLFVAQAVLAGLHHQRQTGIDGFQRLFLEIGNSELRLG